MQHLRHRLGREAAAHRTRAACLFRSSHGRRLRERGKYLVLRDFPRNPEPSRPQSVRVTSSLVEAADGLCYLQDCQSLLTFPLTLPIMPFTPNEALAPGCTKVLHLYEEKDLELLEAVLAGNISQSASASCDDGEQQQQVGEHGDGRGGGSGGGNRARVFVHSTIEMGSAHAPCVACASSTPGALVAGEFVFFLSTLVQVLDVNRAPHGGLDVTIRGEGRVRISRLKQLNPYITGEVWPVQDVVPREVLDPPEKDTWPSWATAPTTSTTGLQPPQSPGGAEAMMGGAWLGEPIQISDPSSSSSSSSSSPSPTIHNLGPTWGGASPPPQALDPLGPLWSGGSSALPPPTLDWTQASVPEADCLAPGPPPEREAAGAGSGQGAGTATVAGASPADVGWVLRCMVQELKDVSRDVHSLLVRLNRHEPADQLTEALLWADDPSPLMCNLGTGLAAAELWCINSANGSRAANGTGGAAGGTGGAAGGTGGPGGAGITAATGTGAAAVGTAGAAPSAGALGGSGAGMAAGNGTGATAGGPGAPGAAAGGTEEGASAGAGGGAGPATVAAVPLPCAVSQLDKATRLSFALLALAQGAGGEGWTGGPAEADPRRAALCTLDTRERLQLVLTAAKSARARLAAQAALRRIRRF